MKTKIPDRSTLKRAGRALALTVLVATVALTPRMARASDQSGAVYVLNNQAANAVMVYARSADGTLQSSGSVSTGGMGMGTGADPLGSQGSLVLGGWGLLLFAVNAGSNDISVFAVQPPGINLKLVDRTSSWGTMPVSIAVRGGLVYVLNAGGTPNIQGFYVQPFTGKLTHLAGSGRALPGGAASSAAEVAFSPSGEVLMVTEKGTGNIDTWHVNGFGYADQGTTTSSNGAEPFGFAFDRSDDAIVSEAVPSALSSYEVSPEGALRVLTGSLGDTQKANCWVVITRQGRYAFTTNTGSGTISSYLVMQQGFLSLLNSVAASTGAGTAPIDMALSSDSRFLYVRDAVKGAVDGFSVGDDGSLTLVTSVTGVPMGAQGVAAH